MKLRIFLPTFLAPLTALLFGGCSPTASTTTVAPDSSTAAKPADSSTSVSSQKAPVSSGPTESKTSRRAISTSASQGPNSPLLFGNPSGAVEGAGGTPDNQLVLRPQLDLSYNQKNGGPNWVAWHLDQGDIGRARRGKFEPDPLLPPASQIRPNDYRGSGYDRGHLCPSGDRTSSRQNNDATFIMSNMLPQAPALNQQVWSKLENYARDQVRSGNEIYAFAGGVGSKERIGEGKVNVPEFCWKILLVLPVGEGDLRRVTTSTRVVAVLMPNVDSPELGGSRWAKHLTTVDDLEQRTGYDFFSALPDDIENALESKKDSGRGSNASSGSGQRSNDRSGRNSSRRNLPSANQSEAPVSLPQWQQPPTSQSSNSNLSTGSEPSAPSSGSGQVWVNTRSGVYHYPGTRWYGNTKEGTYMTEAEALAQGNHAAGNGQ